MRHYILLLLAVFAASLTSCRNDFDFEPSAGGLEFSRDTVYLDTVFTNIGSSTYTLKVYNRSDKDISIPSVKLTKGDTSNYRLMVDGQPGKSFNNVEVMAKDSLFIFIETTADIANANPETFLYTDDIEFSSTNGLQKVNLVTLIQDAIFIKPNRPLPADAKETLTLSGMQSDIQGHELTDSELNWTRTKPYVVYGYALVPNGKTLSIAAGTRVHFHAESGLIVDSNATLNINGAPSGTPEMENEVIFEGDRLEPDFAETPGQWGSILLFSTTDNIINHLTLKNAAVGIIMQSLTQSTLPKLTIKNSQIYNCSNIGLLTRGAIVNAENFVTNNCGQAAVALTLGGTYNFKHCTIANYFNAFNQVPLIINDYQETQQEVLVSNLNARFDNCILYGSGNLGISLEQVGASAGTVFNYTFNHCLIKFIDTGNQLANNPFYNFESGSFNNCIIARSSVNDKPNFQDPQKNKLNIDETSVAYQKADVTVSATVPFDVKNTIRQTPASLGAYEAAPFE